MNNDAILVSECCGKKMPDYPDSDICPRCREHTGVEEIEEENTHDKEKE